MKKIKVITNCDEVLTLKENEVLKDDLGIFIKCPFKDGCSGTCNVTIE